MLLLLNYHRLDPRSAPTLAKIDFNYRYLTQVVGAWYGLLSSFRHVTRTHLERNFLTNCLPCTIQNLALSSVRVDDTPPCMTRLWLSWTILEDIMCLTQESEGIVELCSNTDDVSLSGSRPFINLDVSQFRYEYVLQGVPSYPKNLLLRTVCFSFCTEHALDVGAVHFRKKRQSRMQNSWF